MIGMTIGKSPRGEVYASATVKGVRLSYSENHEYEDESDAWLGQFIARAQQAFEGLVVNGTQESR